jgi:hypothetical protein
MEANQKNIDAVEALDRFGDQHPAAEYGTQLKTRIKLIGESLQEFALTTEQLTHHALPELHEGHVRKGIGKAFVDGTAFSTSVVACVSVAAGACFVCLGNVFRSRCLVMDNFSC